MFCSNCGKQLPVGSVMCMACKTRVHVPAIAAVAAEIVPIVVAPPRAKPRSRVVYALLAILLGFIGVHNFYAGRVVRGLIQLAISVAGSALVFPLALVWLWAIIEIGAVSTDGSNVPMIWVPQKRNP